MKKILVLSCFIILSATYVVADGFEQSINSKIERVDPNVNIGIKITNLSKERVVFEKNSSRYFTPASTLKFVSLISLLDYFGFDYKFTNKLYVSKGNYYLDIHDPDFQTKDLDNFVQKIYDHAGSKVKGDIYISDNSFTLPQLMRTKMQSDTLYCYGSPITLVSINKNCEQIIASPGKVGQRIKINLGKNFPYKVENNARTIEKNQFDRLYTSLKGDKYIIDGTLNAKTGKVYIGAVANDSKIHLKNYIKSSLQKQGIKFTGKIKYGNVPNKVKPIYVIEKTLPTIISKALKFSDNFITDYILAEFALKNKLNDWPNATASLKKLIKQNFSTDMNMSEIHDASGISRLNLVTVNQMSDFLNATSKHKNFESIKLLMAIPGEEGSAEKRFNNNKDIFVKTGYLSGVSSVVGYFYKNRELYSFVIITNNYYSNVNKYRKLEEDIIDIISSS